MKENRKSLQRARALALAAAYCCSMSVAHADEKETKFEVYGFGQADYVQDFRRVDPAWDDTLRPSRIPTDEGQFGTDGQAIISPRQSRFGVQGSIPVQDKSLKTKFEFDLFGVGVDEGKTTIRLRHAYGQWGAFLGGQTHSLFMDGDAFPNIIDYWGPTGMVFFRTPQIRWTPVDGPISLAFAIEKPGSDVDSGQIEQLDPDLGAAIQGDEKLPDLTAQIRTSGDMGYVLLAGIARRLGFDTPGAPESAPKGFEIGWGLNLSGSLKFGDRNRLILSGVYGQGIASYMNDGGTDLAPEGTPGNLSAKAVPLFGIMAYYDLYWSDQWSTSLGYSRTQVENTSFQSGSAYFSGEYASINLLHTPDKKILYGGEFLWGRRTDNDGDTGNDIRIQISYKYSFSAPI